MVLCERFCEVCKRKCSCTVTGFIHSGYNSSSIVTSIVILSEAKDLASMQQEQLLDRTCFHFTIQPLLEPNQPILKRLFTVVSWQIWIDFSANHYLGKMIEIGFLSGWIN